MSVKLEIAIEVMKASKMIFAAEIEGVLDPHMIHIVLLKAVFILMIVSDTCFGERLGSFSSISPRIFMDFSILKLAFPAVIDEFWYGSPRTMTWSLSSAHVRPHISPNFSLRCTNDFSVWSDSTMPLKSSTHDQGGISRFSTCVPMSSFVVALWNGAVVKFHRSGLEIAP